MDKTVPASAMEPPALRLIRMILDLPENRQAALLKVVEEYAANGNELHERDDVRHPYKNAIAFVCNDQSHDGLAQDISEGGMFIKTEATLSVGQMIIIKVPFSDHRKVIHVPAEIVRAVDGGIGVKFFKKVATPEPQTA